MNNVKITRIGAIRLGNDYQDVVALDLIVKHLEHPKDFEWIKVEAYEEAKYLDDVYAKRSNGKIIARQVKYAIHSEETWDWKDLLKINKKNGKSLLQKLFESWGKIHSQGEIEEIALWTNRNPGPKIKITLNQDQKIKIQNLEEDILQEIIKQCNDFEKVKNFFEVFQFRFSQQDLNTLNDTVLRRLENLGVGSDGRNSLKEAVREWTIDQNKPSPDGNIRLKDIKFAALWYNLKPIPQNFEVPADYVLPSDDFHERVLNIIETVKESVIVINAPPALGKSTYLSYLYHELRRKQLPVIRHHYFLSIRDKFPDRFSHRKIFESLMKEIQNSYFDPIEDDTRNPSPEFFTDWLRKCGNHFLQKGKPFIVIIDGLDHVFREQESILELNHLFNQLLPVENGVLLIVGTQPVENRQLPTKLLRLKSRDTWMELPLLSRDAIERWIIKHANDISLDLHEKNDINFKLPALVNSFYRISKGHPLVLKVSLQELLIKNHFITEYEVNRLTEHLNSRDISEYYNQIWLTISTSSKFILVLFTCCPYEWRKEEVLEVLSSPQSDRISFVDAFESIRHLLLNDFLGWRLYHPSIKSFIQQTPEFSDNRNYITDRALHWIKNGKSKYLKWAYEWVLEAEVGNPEALINSTSRQWVINSLANLYPEEDISLILQKAGEYSLQNKSFRRFVVNGLVADYYLQGIDYQNEGLRKLLLPRTYITDEELVIKKLRANIFFMDDEELLDYARLQKELDNEDKLFEIFEELNNRTKFAEHPGNVESSVRILTRIAALSEKVTTDRVIRYIKSNRKSANNIQILNYFCSECLYSKLKSRIIDLLENSTSLFQEEINFITGFAALLSIEDNTSLTGFLNSTKINSSLWNIYLYLIEKLNNPIDIEFPSMEFLNIPEYEHYKYRDFIEESFYKIFFVFLTNQLMDKGHKNEEFLSELGDHSWSRKFIKILNDFSISVNHKLKNKEVLKYSEILIQFKDFNKPDFIESRDDYEFGQCAGKAIIQIANELIRIFRFLIPSLTISRQEMEETFSSSYVYPTIWIEKYLEHNRKYLDQEGFEYLLRRITEILNTTIEEFSGRSIDYALLSRVCVLHGDKIQCSIFVKKCIENTIAYGGHKDLYFSGCLEIIENLYKKGVAETKNWLLSIIVPIININEYTDGRETRNTPEDLADTFTLVNKEMLLDYYNWFLKHEEYWYADYTFHQYLTSNNLSDDMNKALARTAIDIKSLDIFDRKAKAGNLNALEILNFFKELYGEYKPTIEQEEKQSVSYDSISEDENKIGFKKYPPEKFEDYLKLFKDRNAYEMRKPLQDWLLFWSKTSKVVSAINAIENLFRNDDEDYELSNKLFSLVLQYKGASDAYPLLVKSFISNYSWQRYFIDRKQVQGTFSIIKRQYTDRWEQFICDTMRDRYSKKILIGASSKYHHIIELLITLDQIELAKEIGYEVINFGLELVSPLNFNKPEWILKYE